MARTLIGTVTSDRNDKTITIAVHERRTHPIYKKQYSVTRKFRAHDEKNDAHVGDKVEVVECRPMSASKNWNLVQVIERNKGSEISLADEPVVAKEKPAKTEEAKAADKPEESTE